MSSYIFDIDKISGMFWGLVIGDALGACYEYDTSIKWTGLIPRNSKSLFSYGQVTDDTELTISLLDSIITYNLENNIKGYPLSYDSFYSINSYIDWYNSEPVEISSHCEYLFSVDKYIKYQTLPVGENSKKNTMKGNRNDSSSVLDTGARTSLSPEGVPRCDSEQRSCDSPATEKYKNRWIKYQERLKNYYEDNNNCNTDNSCLMRATPLVFCNIGDALLDCRQTHCHLVCEDAVSIYVQILKNCLTTKIQSNYDNNLATAISTKSEKIRETNIFASTRECKALIENVLKRKERILDMNKSDVLTTLYCGLNAYAFFDTFESAMEWLFSYHIDNKLGLGDSDSNASIMGAIIGAKIGLRAMLQETKTNFNYNIVSTIKTNRPIDYQPSMRLNYLLQELTKLLRYG